MILQLLDGVSSFVVDTAVLLVSGCVSLVVLSGGVALLAVFGARQLKSISSKKIAENKRKADESFGRTETPIESESKSALNCDSTGGDRVKWFVTSTEKDFGTLKHLKQTPTTVASNGSVSSSEKDAEVREFLEHLIGTLISENLDDVPLTPLSNDVQYESIFAEYHSKLSSVLSALSGALHSTSNSESTDGTDKPSNLYVRLKMIINEVSEKASQLPPLLEYDNESEPLSIESRLEGQSYEDILATAVLNKIISKCQNGKEPFSFSDEVDLNITSDFEYRCNNNSSNSSPQERLSLTVEEHIEEITTRYTSSDDDENEPIVGCLQSFNLNTIHRAHFPELGKDVVDGYDSYDEDSVMEIVSNVDSWEDNWLFQKKKKNKIKTTVAQVSVPMLVPNPSEKYRALIGDVDVDETSDLSECSDSILEELTDFDTEKIDSALKTNYIYKYDFKNNLDPSSLKGKHFDDSENCSADHDQDSSGVTSISRDISDVYSFSSLSPCQSEDDSLPWTGIREAKNQSIFLAQEDSGEGSLDTQPENEYLNGDELEHHISQNKVLNERDASRRPDSEYNRENNIPKTSNENQNSSLTEELAQPPRPGTIAEREHAKWEHAAPLPNNPYSKENIERRNFDNLYARCSSTNSSLSDQNNEAVNDECRIEDPVLRADIKKYKRDYYVNLGHTNGATETKSENGVTHVKSNDEYVSQNGLPKIVSNHDEKPNKKSNLVRVSSWSDRKQPDIEIKKRLPSVKELAKQFSVQPNFHEVNKTSTNKNQMVHSLTARSMSKQFREGLKNNIGKTFNRNALANKDDGTDKTEEDLHENGDLDVKNKLNNTISFWENI